MGVTEGQTTFASHIFCVLGGYFMNPYQTGYTPIPPVNPVVQAVKQSQLPLYF